MIFKLQYHCSHPPPGHQPIILVFVMAGPYSWFWFLCVLGHGLTCYQRPPNTALAFSSCVVFLRERGPGRGASLLPVVVYGPRSLPSYFSALSESVGLTCLSSWVADVSPFLPIGKREHCCVVRREAPPFRAVDVARSPLLIFCW